VVASLPINMTFQRSTRRVAWLAAAVTLAAGLKIDQGGPSPAPAMGGPPLPPGAAPAAASAAGGAAAKAPPAGPPPWAPAASSYDKNGVDWVEGMCFSRERQSPINFDDHLKDPPGQMLKYHYEPLRNVKLQMQANKGLIYIDTSNLNVGSVEFNGYMYPLVRIDFHANSEHLIKGKRFAMEIQLVHRRIDDPAKSLVIAVPVWSEKTPLAPMTPLKKLLETPLGPYFPPLMTEPDHNSVLEQFLTVRPPTKEGQVVDVVIPLAKPLDLGFFVENPMLPGSGTYIQYSGSLTTPPCSDMTTWFVRRRPMLASDGQTKAFADSIFRLTNKHGNFRAVMPVNARVLEVFRAQWVMTLQLGNKRLPLGPNARTDKEFQAEKLADLAKDLSQDAVDYMSDFGKRLRRSARGLQKNLDKGRVLYTTPSPTNSTADEWQKAVMKMRTSMQGIVNGVKASVDKEFRSETMHVHKHAAREGERARMMTAAWTSAATGQSQGAPLPPPAAR